MFHVPISYHNTPANHHEIYFWKFSSQFTAYYYGFLSSSFCFDFCSILIYFANFIHFHYLYSNLILPFRSSGQLYFCNITIYWTPPIQGLQIHFHNIFGHRRKGHLVVHLDFRHSQTRYFSKWTFGAADDLTLHWHCQSRVIFGLI